jgi:Arc/MetJ-type ribon-helix-helix transcriptional regulator
MRATWHLVREAHRFATAARLPYVEIMTVELNPELERIIEEQLASGQFRSVDEVLATALAQLPHRHDPQLNDSAVKRMIEFSRTHSVKLPPGETVEALVREIRQS